MPKLHKQLTRFMRDESGPTAVEYAVMLALIIGVCIGSVTLFGSATEAVWGNNAGSITSAFNN